eukprot:Skav217536  [mRNA]  locus=scaffold467:61270:68998:+ [translate_table: standard]
MVLAKVECNVDEAYFQAIPPTQAAPSWSIPRASKDAAKKLHISSKHKTDTLGMDTPGPGAYMPRRQRKSRSCSFGKSVRPASAPASRACTRDLLAMISGDKPQADDYLPRSSRPTIDRASRTVHPAPTTGAAMEPPATVSPHPRASAQECHRGSARLVGEPRVWGCSPGVVSGWEARSRSRDPHT